MCVCTNAHKIECNTISLVFIYNLWRWDGFATQASFYLPANNYKRPKLIKIGFYSSKLVATVGVEYMPVTIWKMRNNEATSLESQAQDEIQ